MRQLALTAVLCSSLLPLSSHALSQAQAVSLLEQAAVCKIALKKQQVPDIAKAFKAEAQTLELGGDGDPDDFQKFYFPKSPLLVFGEPVNAFTWNIDGITIYFDSKVQSKFHAQLNMKQYAKEASRLDFKSRGRKLGVTAMNFEDGNAYCSLCKPPYPKSLLKCQGNHTN